MRIIMPVWAVDDTIINVTEAAVESLKGHHLTIIDNGSPVGGGRLREWADVYIRNKTNLGYARAVNQGLKLYLTETVAIANNDIKVSPGWDTVAQEVLQEDGVMSVHFRMIPYDEPFNLGKDTWTSGKERWCSSSFFVVRAVQLYDENFLNSYDDYDYWYRIRQKGGKTAYTNRAAYQHLDSFTQKKVENRSENDKRNYEYYKQKHGEYPDIQFAKLFPDQVTLSWRPFP